MLKFISFGSGSSGNCYLLYTEDDYLMIDCGVGARTLKKHFHNYGMHISSVRNILLTHDHADHVKSVGSLSSEFNIPVYSTKLVHEGILGNWCVRKKIEKTLVKCFEKGKATQIGSFLVTPFSIPHDSTDCVGYMIECQGVKFGIVTDCGHITEEVKQCISSVNYLILEANYEKEKLLQGPYPEHLKKRILSENGHLSNEECAQALVENATPELRKVWLCHLSDENNHPELARLTVENILRANGIVPGKEFDLEVLKRKTPSEIETLVK